jgi:hypothetical protein
MLGPAGSAVAVALRRHGATGDVEWTVVLRRGAAPGSAAAAAGGLAPEGLVGGGAVGDDDDDAASVSSFRCPLPPSTHLKQLDSTFALP